MSLINRRNGTPIGNPSTDELASSERGACWSDHGIDRLKALRGFCLVARLGSITRATEKLSVTQPLVSMHVRALEISLGAELFERRGRRVALTPVGETRYRLADPLVASLDRLCDTFRDGHIGEAKGVLTIGTGHASANHLLPRYLKRFHDQHPRVRIQVRTGTGEQRLAWLRDYEMDLIVAAIDVPPSDVAFYPIVDSEFVLVTPQNHPLAGKKKPVTVGEAAPYPFIAHPPGHYFAQATEAFMRLHRVLPNVVVEVDGWDAITSHVVAGVGVAVVPEICTREDDRIRKLSFEDPVPTRWYGAVIRRDALLSRPASLFIRTLALYRPVLSEHP